VIFAVLDLRVAEVVLKRIFKLLSFFTIIRHKSQIERTRKRAIKIIFENTGIDYENLCMVHKLDTLEACRTNLCKSFFRNRVLNESSKLLALPISLRADDS